MAGMVQAGQDLGLALEILLGLAPLALGGKEGAHLLDHAQPAKQLHVAGQVDGAHAPLPQLADDLVAATLQRRAHRQGFGHAVSPGKPAAASRTPHLVQKRASGLTGAPHCGQFASFTFSKLSSFRATSSRTFHAHQHDGDIVLAAGLIGRIHQAAADGQRARPRRPERPPAAHGIDHVPQPIGTEEQRIAGLQSSQTDRCPPRCSA